MGNKITKVTLKESKKLFSKTFPNYVRFAVSNTMNKVAFEGMKNHETWVKRNWTLRNKFVLGGGQGKGAMKFQRSKPSHDIDSIFSKSGSVDRVGSKNFKFMEDQERGFESKGSTPTLQARTGKNYRKSISGRNKRLKSNIERLRGASRRMVVVHLRRLYKKEFALPGSKQFFFMRDNQFLNFGSGLYQFARKTRPKKLSSSGNRLQFPNLKKVFRAGKDNNKQRKSTSWMEKSNRMMKQSDIDKTFDKAANQAFSGQLKMWKS